MRNIKNIRFLLSVLMVFIMAICVGCQGGNSSGGNNGGSSESNEPDSTIVKIDPYEFKETNIKENGCYVLADFESYAQCYDIFWGHTFGKIIQNTDSTYITRGLQSAKLEIWGREQWGGSSLQPYMRIYTNNRFFQKANFSDCDYLMFDIYNTMSYSVKMEVTTSTDNVVDQGEAVVVNLVPGWNYVKVLISDIAPDPSYITSFAIFFQRMDAENGEARIIYMDNVRAHIVGEN